MGLDMYLNAKRYLWDADKDIKDKIADEALPEIKAEIKTIIVKAAYWRKANAIHKWFVDKIQDGADDCREYNVTLEQLQDLVALCKEVLSNKEKALELLPPINGFFFGSNETDDWYWESLENTITQLEECLKWPAEWDFYYDSSW
jgi:hypothetical protein